jgi:hypothetical protein
MEGIDFRWIMNGLPETDPRDAIPVYYQPAGREGDTLENRPPNPREQPMPQLYEYTRYSRRGDYIFHTRLDCPDGLRIPPDELDPEGVGATQKCETCTAMSSRPAQGKGFYGSR